MNPEPLTLSVEDDSVAAPSTETREARVRRLIQTHYDSLWRFVRRLGVEPTDLDDAMQQVFEIAARRLNDVSVESERSFLFATAFRIGSEQRRRHDARREIDDAELVDLESPAPEPDILADQARARAVLDRVLAAMPTELRAVFMLYEIEEMTMAEIAGLLGLPPGTVASRVRRATAEFEARVERLQAEMRRKRVLP